MAKFGAVLVFGDIGRSPRMQNHALEITKQTDYNVYLIGYKESQPHQKLQNNKKIQIIEISTKFIDKIKKLPKIFYLVYAFLRIITQIFQLLLIFMKLKNTPDFVIVQNPPSIPVLFVMFIVTKLKKIKFIIDFHNYGYTILQLNLKNKLILKLATIYEQYFGKKCDYSFCVSQNMKNDLKQTWKIKNSQVLYDKAQKDIFSIFDINQKHQFYEKLFYNQEEQSNPFTQINQNTGQVEYKKNREFLLVSSTSWTKDEDFSILLNAMEQYEQTAKNNDQNIKYPKLKLVITGKGPEKQFYLNIIQKQKQNWKFIDIQTMWLEAEDYPKLLASADLGICLHYSSSGFDLPMKVVDMFGAGLPVLAINYISINELVQNKENGYIFNDQSQLYQLLVEIFGKWETKYENIITVKFKNNIQKFRELDFQQEWKNVVKPVLDNIKNKREYFCFLKLQKIILLNQISKFFNKWILPFQIMPIIFQEKVKNLLQFKNNNIPLFIKNQNELKILYNKNLQYLCVKLLQYFIKNQRSQQILLIFIEIYFNYSIKLIFNFKITYKIIQKKLK